MQSYWALEPQYATFDDKIRDTKCKPLKDFYYQCSRNLKRDPQECTLALDDYRTCKQIYEKIKDK